MTRPQVRPPAAEEWSADDRRPLTMIQAMAIARRLAEETSRLEFDSIVRSEKLADGGWNIRVDLIESRARMGNNDLISCFAITLSADAELTAYSRLHRYYREKGAPDDS